MYRSCLNARMGDSNLPAKAGSTLRRRVEYPRRKFPRHPPPRNTAYYSNLRLALISPLAGSLADRGARGAHIVPIGRPLLNPAIRHNKYGLLYSQPDLELGERSAENDEVPFLERRHLLVVPSLQYDVVTHFGFQARDMDV